MEPSSHSAAFADETLDTILRGRVRVLQPRQGQRLTTDPLLLADFALHHRARRPKRGCELGSGTGVLALALAALDNRLSIVGIEIDDNLVGMARRSLVLNRLEGRIHIEHADFRKEIPLAPGFDLVLANPPYHAPGTGKIATRPGRAQAHHEGACSLEDVVACACRLATARAELGVIYPADRLSDLVRTLDQHRFRPRVLRFVHPRASAPASRVLILARLSTKVRLVVHPPLILHEGLAWSAEAKTILEGRQP